MKALSLWQPWATWIAQGKKTIETRMWPCRYRGPLLICAAKKVDPWYREQRPDDRFPLGKAVAVCELIMCVPMRRDHENQAMCEWEPGRWAWILGDIRAIGPFTVKGQRGLFEVPIRMEDLVMAKKAVLVEQKYIECGEVYTPTGGDQGYRDYCDICMEAKQEDADQAGDRFRDGEEASPKAPRISDDQAVAIFEKLSDVTTRRVELSAAKARSKSAQKAVDTAQGELEQLLYDARSGQTSLFSAPPAEEPAEEPTPEQSGLMVAAMVEQGQDARLSGYNASPDDGAQE